MSRTRSMLTTVLLAIAVYHLLQAMQQLRIWSANAEIEIFDHLIARKWEAGFTGTPYQIWVSGRCSSTICSSPADTRHEGSIYWRFPREHSKALVLMSLQDCLRLLNSFSDVHGNVYLHIRLYDCMVIHRERGRLRASIRSEGFERYLIFSE